MVECNVQTLILSWRISHVFWSLIMQGTIYKKQHLEINYLSTRSICASLVINADIINKLLIQVDGHKHIYQLKSRVLN